MSKNVPNLFLADGAANGAFSAVPSDFSETVFSAKAEMTPVRHKKVHYFEPARQIFGKNAVNLRSRKIILKHPKYYD